MTKRVLTSHSHALVPLLFLLLAAGNAVKFEQGAHGTGAAWPNHCYVDRVKVHRAGALAVIFEKWRHCVTCVNCGAVEVRINGNAIACLETLDSGLGAVV